jgi:hypothetical protein
VSLYENPLSSAIKFERKCITGRLAIPLKVMPGDIRESNPHFRDIITCIEVTLLIYRNRAATMTQHYELASYAEYKETSDWLTEREKLANGLESLRRTSERMAAKAQELHELCDKVHFNLADSQSLRIKLKGIIYLTNPSHCAIIWSLESTNGKHHIQTTANPNRRSSPRNA